MSRLKVLWAILFITVFVTVQTAQAQCFLQQLHPVTSHVDQVSCFDDDPEDNKQKNISADFVYVRAGSIYEIVIITGRHHLEIPFTPSTPLSSRPCSRAPPA